MERDLFDLELLPASDDMDEALARRRTVQPAMTWRLSGARLEV